MTQERSRTRWGFVHVDKEYDPGVWVELSTVEVRCQGWQRANEKALVLGDVREAAGRLWHPDPKPTTIEWYLCPEGEIHAEPAGASCQLAALLILLGRRGFRLRSTYASLGRVWVSCALGVDASRVDCLDSAHEMAEKLQGFLDDDDARLFVGPMDTLQLTTIDRAQLARLGNVRSALERGERVVLGLEANELQAFLNEVGAGGSARWARRYLTAPLIVGAVVIAMFVRANDVNDPPVLSPIKEPTGSIVYSPDPPEWMRAEDACGPVRFVPRTVPGGALSSPAYVSGTATIEGTCAHEPDQNSIVRAALRPGDGSGDAVDVVVDRIRQGTGSVIVVAAPGVVPVDRPSILQAIEVRARSFTRPARMDHGGRLVGETSAGFAATFRREETGPRFIALVRFPGGDRNGYAVLCDEAVAAGDLLVPVAGEQSLPQLGEQFGFESSEELLNAIASCTAMDRQESFHEDLWREDLRGLLRPIIERMGTDRRHRFARRMGRPECVSVHDRCLVRALVVAESSRREAVLICYADLLGCVNGDDDQNDVIEVFYDVLETEECTQ